MYLVEQEVENQDFLTWAKNHSGNSGDLKILKESQVMDPLDPKDVPWDQNFFSDFFLLLHMVS